MKCCPYCAEEIQDAAIKCKHCGEFLDKRPASKTPWYFRAGFLVLCLLVVGPLALPLVWLNPYYGKVRKWIFTVIILLVSWGLGMLLRNSIESISAYYRMIEEVYY